MTVEVIIDTLGRAEPGSLTVLGSASQELTEWATYIAYNAQYTPAEVAGRKVRMCVHIPFIVGRRHQWEPVPRRPNHGL